MLMVCALVDVFITNNSTVVVKNLTAFDLDVDKFISRLNSSICDTTMTGHTHSHSREPFELIVSAFNHSLAFYPLTIVSLNGLAGVTVLWFLCLYLRGGRTPC